MRTRGAVLREAGTEYEIVDLEVVDPGPGEVLVEMAYAGLCHSDEHLRHVTRAASTPSSAATSAPPSSSRPGPASPGSRPSWSSTG